MQDDGQEDAARENMGLSPRKAKVDTVPKRSHAEADSGYPMRGCLNLLQLMTGGNEELKFIPYETADEAYILKQHFPPGIPIPLSKAYQALVNNGHAQMPGGGTLVVSAPLGSADLILAPGIINLKMVEPQKAELKAMIQGKYGSSVEVASRHIEACLSES